MDSVDCNRHSIATGDYHKDRRFRPLVHNYPASLRCPQWSAPRSACVLLVKIDNQGDHFATFVRTWLQPLKPTLPSWSIWKLIVADPANVMIRLVQVNSKTNNSLCIISFRLTLVLFFQCSFTLFARDTIIKCLFHAGFRGRCLVVLTSRTI